MKKNVCIITFASTKYKGSALLQSIAFKLLGYSHKILSPADLQTPLQDYCSRFTRGYGYWRWKPHVILSELKKLQSNQIRLWYLDACILPLALNPFPQNDRVYIMSTIYTDIRQWAKPLPDPIAESISTKAFFCNSPNVDASVIGFTQDESSFVVLELWKRLCDCHDLVSDASVDNAYHPNISLFKDHRHDQTLLAVCSSHLKIGLSTNLCTLGSKAFFHHRVPIVDPISFSKVFLSFLYHLLVKIIVPQRFQKNRFLNISAFYPIE
jgi:hypothetical protein